MNTQDTQLLYSEARAHFGLRSQLTVAAEESAELSAAVSQFINEKVGIDSVYEEIADVEIMIAQIVQNMGSEARKKINEYKEIKHYGLKALINKRRSVGKVDVERSNITVSP